jgi:hypothetical protein
MAVIGVLHLLVMYAITNVAAVRHLRRGGARWAGGSLVAAAVFTAVRRRGATR